jgi:hypothetical protein
MPRVLRRWPTLIPKVVSAFPAAAVTIEGIADLSHLTLDLD